MSFVLNIADVIRYNALLALNQLTEHADCVMLVERLSHGALLPARLCSRTRLGCIGAPVTMVTVVTGSAPASIRMAVSLGVTLMLTRVKC